ncbi:MAG TPA: NAD(P)H-dependent oxidoreductase subunit E [Dermatophilaceae bacterium]|nr:NAD(P)H-dependent oxidoreductase subunit E [Dermatophilaceae bacterium]
MGIDAARLLDRHGHDRTRLLDMLWEVQRAEGHLPQPVVEELAAGLGTTAGDIHETASFYHFFHDEPGGRHRVYLADTVVAKMRGYADVRAALERETGACFGGPPDPTGTFSLHDTPCIGLSDQEPAMLVDEVVFTRLRPGKVADIVGQLRAGLTAEEVANPVGLPRDEVAYVDNLVETNVRTKGPVFFRYPADYRMLLRDCLVLTPEQITERISESGLRGRGGAGFSTGLKWQLCRSAYGDRKYVICNADEGEPGTFKDRVLLTRSPKQVFTGMVIAAYAIGASGGLVYLRAEYAYLQPYLERQLEEMRADGLLGHDILGRAPFDFDIRIQLGAGAYVCGEESALIESCEGKRGTPRLKPPFPAQQGYLGQPTCIDNVESFGTITRILEEGPGWFRAMGTADSAGTRLISVAGDARKPGVYEVEWGTTLAEALALVGAEDARAVQVAGPSGECVSPELDGERRLAFEDLSCNGAFTVFGRDRDLLRVVRDYVKFFADESCGICVPCRVGNTELLHKVDLFLAGRASEPDVEDLRRWSAIIRGASRCGLGATSPKPVLTTLSRFPEIYRERMAAGGGPLLPAYDLAGQLAGYDAAIRELEGELR